MIDVLRASTTICAALQNGAAAVLPFLETDEVLNCSQMDPQNILAGGERGGEKVPGFDLGNSPAEYDCQTVTGKTIAFSTTNGTKAMQRCVNAKHVFIGAFCNFSALCRQLESAQNVDLICAGTNGKVTLEDSLFAGAVVDFLAKQSAGELDDQAQICRALWQSCSARVQHFLEKSQGGANLIRLGKQADIEFAARFDTFSVVPKLDIPGWKIEPA